NYDVSLMQNHLCILFVFFLYRLLSLFFFIILNIVSSEIVAIPLFTIDFDALALMPFEVSIILFFNLVVILECPSIKSNCSAKVLTSHWGFLQKNTFVFIFNITLFS